MGDVDERALDDRRPIHLDPIPECGAHQGPDNPAVPPTQLVLVIGQRTFRVQTGQERLPVIPVDVEIPGRHLRRRLS